MRAFRAVLFAAVAAPVLMTMTACVGGTAASVYAVRTGGNAETGRQVITELRCGACHVIPGIRNAEGMVGPPLLFFSRRTMIAGEIPNTPQNLERWVLAPKSVEPGTAMPALVATPQQARDIAAYLYTLR